MGRKKYEKEEDQYFQYPNLAKDNMLIGAKYKASLLELRTTYASLMMIQDGKYREEEDGYYVEMTAAQLGDIIGVNGGAFYKQLRPVAEHMTNRTFGVVDDNNESFDFINLIIEAKYSDGVFTVVFNKKMKEHIMNLEKDFTPLPKSLMMAFNSEYSFRLYELLKKACYYPKTYKGPKNGKFRIEMSVSELKLSIGVVNSALDAVQKELKKSPKPDYDRAVAKSPERLYENWADFRRRCLDPPIEEINAKSDIQVSYEAQKSGRGGKTYAVRFNVYVEALDETHSDAEIIVPLNVDREGNAKFEPETNEKFSIWWEAGRILNDDSMELDDVMNICDAAQYDLEVIKGAARMCEKQGSKVENKVGWIIDCIRKNYQEIPGKPNAADERDTDKSKQERGKKNSFNDFKQNDIDFEELEKRVFKN